MPVELHQCVIASCDVCDAPAEEEYGSHFSSRLEARQCARNSDWTVVGDHFVCTHSDIHHERARAVLLPEPTPHPSQLAIN